MRGTKDSLVNRILNSTKNAIKTTTVVQEETINVIKLEELEVFTNSVDIVVKTHDEGKIDVTLETYEDGPELSIKKTKDKVKIQAVKEKQSANWFFNVMPACCLHIKVPKDVANNWKVRTGSGEVVVSNILAETIEAEANSGELEVSDIIANHVRLKASSGEIDAVNFQVDELTVSVSSGDATVDTVNGNVYGEANSGSIILKRINGENVEARVSSGEISIEDTNVIHTALEATSGDIMVKRVQSETTEAKVTSGDIIMKNLGGNIKGHANSGDIQIDLEDGSSLDLETGSGDINVILQGKNASAALDIHTRSGDISTDIPLSIESKSDYRVQAVVGDGDHPVRLQSGSGDITIY